MRYTNSLQSDASHFYIGAGARARDTSVCERLDHDWRAQGVAVCCSVVQCGSVWCSVLQCVAVCCSVFALPAIDLNVTGKHKVLQDIADFCNLSNCNVLQCARKIGP